MDVKDDISIVVAVADAREGGVRGRSAVVFESAQAVFETACVGEGEGFRDLDDEDVRDEFQASVFGVIELVAGAWDAAQDLDPWACGVF